MRLVVCSKRWFDPDYLHSVAADSDFQVNLLAWGMVGLPDDVKLVQIQVHYKHSISHASSSHLTQGETTDEGRTTAVDGGI